MNQNEICPHCKGDGIKFRDGKIVICFPCGGAGKKHEDGTFHESVYYSDNKLRSEARKIFFSMRGM